jgi:adenylate cyclase
MFLAVATPEWQELELGVFDLLLVLTAPGDTKHPITVVGIDDPSFLELQQQWPWPRVVHARLVEALNRAGAAVIAFDVLFAEPSRPEEDERLEAAIRSSGNVVLVGDLAYQESELYQQEIRIDPLDSFLDAGATTGLSGLVIDGDLNVRRVPTHPDSFWRQVVRNYAKTREGMTEVPTIPPESRIRYVGPDHTFPYVSYYQALEPETFLPPATFEDRIVLVGFDLKTSPEPGAIQTDLFATPFLSYTGRLMPGVEIQANLVANALAGRALEEVSTGVTFALTALVALLCLWGMRNWRPVHSALVGLGLVVGIGAAAGWLFATQDTWLPVFCPWTAALLVYLAQGGAAVLDERWRRQEVKRAFGYYVPPHVVEELTEHPEKLVLGGERRQLTLLFTDLAGFTTLAEEMSPEQVAHYLNRHLTSMTGVIHRHGGTVPKFLGDGIFAFWGAPLEDPEQALHACRAALEMQLANEKFFEESRAYGSSAVHMRIGIHTGPAVVGNMGSSDRFDYTAVGDSVNLASRLEAVNKFYGSEILLSESTAGELPDHITLRPVDKVRVKGKSLPIDLFTPCKNPFLVEASQKAIEAYRKREWDRSETLWQEIVRKYPNDSIAAVYLERIATWRRNPPEGEWDGAVSLEKA